MFAVIMAGGKGTRFWPRSRESMPKHLLDILGERTIIRETGPPGLLVVDEVGPLELRGGGLWPALRDALEAPGPTLLCVVREDILGEFAARLAPLIPAVFDVNDADARMLLEKRLFETSQPHDGQS